MLADTLVPADRAQPHPQQHGLHHRGRDRLPQRQRRDPAGERPDPADPRGARLEHLHDRQVAPLSRSRDEPRLHPSQLADRPRLRALLRLPRCRDQPVVPGPRLRRPPGRAAAHAQRGLPPHRGPHGQGPRVHQGREGRSRPRSRSSCTTRPAPAMRHTTRRRSGSTGSRASSTWATRRSASRRSRARRSWASSPRTQSSRRSTRSGRRRRARAPTGKPFPALDITRPWDSLSADEQKLFSRMAEVYAGIHGARRPPDRPTARLPRGDRAAREHVDHPGIRQRRQRRGRPRTDRSTRRSSPTASPTRSRRTSPRSTSSAAPKTYNHYPNGWAMAFNTPFKMWKRYEFNGGTRDPCIISWPNGIKARGEIRGQYHHAIDLVPTILDAARGRPAREDRRATCRATSTASACVTASTTRSRRARGHAVLFDARLPGDLARRLEGRHDHPTIAGWGNFAGDKWELYHTEVDRSELHDLAAEEPERLQRNDQPLVRRGRRNGAFPIDDRSAIEIVLTPRPCS